MSAALLGLLAALAAPVCGATPTMDRLQAELDRPRGDLLIAAHRAGHLGAPENSLAAIDEANGPEQPPKDPPHA